MREAIPPFQLELDSFDRLVLIDHQGRRHVGVEPVRAFPITDPTRWIALVDAEGRELVFLPSLDDLDPAVRATVEDGLSRREFLPVLNRIVRVQGESHPTEWEVATDRGPTRFTINSDDDLRRFGAHRALLVDSQGVRYLIPDLRDLDPHSRRILEVWL